MKVCNQCKNEKPLSEFYKQNKKKSNGDEYIYYNPKCKSCVRKNSGKWIESNYERYKRLKRNYYHNNEEYRKWKIEYADDQRKEGYLSEWQRKNKDKVYKYNKDRREEKAHNISVNEWKQCKEYFNNSCAYCEMTEVEHRKVFNQDLHKEHVIHEGRNDIKNCVPSCKSCNSSKRTYSLNNWYNPKNEKYTHERYRKICYWIKIQMGKF